MIDSVDFICKITNFFEKIDEKRGEN